MRQTIRRCILFLATLLIPTLGYTQDIVVNEYFEAQNQSLSQGITDLDFGRGDIFIPEGSSKEEQILLKRIAVYDVGSSGVKFKIADVDPANQKIVRILYKTRVDTKAMFGFDVTPDNVKGRLAVMAGLKSIAEQNFKHYYKIEHYAIATAGFRRAGELGEKLARDINLITDINFEIIDQDGEGLLAYYGVLASSDDFDSDKDIVFDMGGGSSQIIIPDPETQAGVRFLGVEVGANVFLEEFLNEVKQSTDVYPITQDELIKGIDLVTYLTINPNSHTRPLSTEDMKLIRKLSTTGSNVYGIGAINNFVIKLYKDINFPDQLNSFSSVNVRDLLFKSIGLSEDEIFKKLKNSQGQQQFVRTDIPSHIFILGLMSNLAIKDITPVNIDNTEGLLMKTMVEQIGMTSDDIQQQAQLLESN